MQIEVIDPRFGHFNHLQFQQIFVLRHSRDFNRYRWNAAYRKTQFIEMITDSTQVEADLVKACIPQAAAEIVSQKSSVGVEPEVNIITTTLANSVNVCQCQIRRHQWLTAAD